jgi:hypothetical protein
MDRAGRRHWGTVLAAATLALVAAPPASAHVVRTIGPYSVEMGWGSEPPVAGFENFVEVTVTSDPGGPVADLGPDAAVAVTFGDAQKAVPLLPTEEPGEFHATLVPTRPGTYAFQVEATVDGREISTGAKCSEGTFDCVIGASEVQFPVADPTAGEVADRVAGTLPRAEEAADDADSAKRLAIAALASAACALGGAVAMALRTRRQSG